VILLSVAGVGLQYVRAQDTKNPPTPRESQSAIPIDLVDVQSQVLQDSLQVNGQVEPLRETVISAEIGERVVALSAERGNRVGQGAVIAQLEDGLAKAQLAEAVAGYSQAVAGRKQAEAEYRRAVVETDAARDAAKAQVAQAEAGAKQATAQVAQAAEGERKARAFVRTQELQQAEAALRQAKADEDLQKAEYERYAYLLKEGVVGQQAYDRIQAGYRAAVARREAAEQGVSLAKEGARQEDIQSAVAQVSQAQAAVANYSAKRQEAQAALRIANTRDTRLEAIRRQIETLKAQENRSAAGVVQARILVAKHRVVAPFTGRILEKQTELGAMLGAGAPVARLGDIAQVKVTFQIPERNRPTLQVGQEVSLTVDALPGERVQGNITALGYQADPRARTFPVEVQLANPQERLLPNMVARLELSGSSPKTVLTIPLSAVAHDGAKSYVFLVEGGKAVRRDIVLGTVFGDRVAVTEGLRKGEKIVATPQRLTEGARVQEGKNR
jgi:RND family efflux transporter MFP subunit